MDTIRPLNSFLFYDPGGHELLANMSLESSEEEEEEGPCEDSKFSRRLRSIDTVKQ